MNSIKSHIKRVSGKFFHGFPDTLFIFPVFYLFLTCDSMLSNSILSYESYALAFLAALAARALSVGLTINRQISSDRM